MLGAMQDWPLRVSTLIDHAAKYHGNRPIVGRSAEGPFVETTWAGVHAAAKKVAQALNHMGYGSGDAIGVMAWNTPRHMEVWYGVSGCGAILHTLNPRLFSEQLDYIINHAGDRVVMVEPDLVKVLEPLVPQLRTVEKWVVLTERANMPQTTLPDAIAYDELLAMADGDYEWATGDENDPCGLCYTSGTTGNPKGVLYSHRSNVLHALYASTPDCIPLSSNDVVMPVVPLFHANGWGLAYTCALNGAAMVMPGRDMTAPGLYEMLEKGVTLTAAVPTIWLGMLQHLRQNKLKFSTLSRVVIGGSSCPRAVIEAFQLDYGAQVIHAWGMTETSPLGSVCSFKPEVASLGAAEKLDVQTTVGHPPYGVDLRITDDDGEELPWDGKHQGKLWVRGPGVVRRYHRMEKDAAEPDTQWFDTGDVATMDPNAYVRITDRSKDVIKSGGEWISSIDLENAAVAHPQVAEAAAIGVPHPKWDERPVLCIVGVNGAKPPKEEILELVGKHFAKWQVPDDVIYMDELPHTATGKISKLELRKKLNGLGYVHPEAA
ncbi:long-chain-fatty-acid--CoA ligase [Albimonas sp. CAU 1670]|uniref:long-chain-fatty-acid--CoA ligase n=1 Tax=Albimonas sp. CAU 1670 TaxID=3032599 RepID=UPI0023DCD66B|nr:long-chain-fatty-acid--CoA ligase [Albimonas sp. CAU 1670]MDF2231313.1 long-chain-fatty-acid--CoA ligase [Albimonas sp. CAU 1670]